MVNRHSKMPKVLFRLNYENDKKYPEESKLSIEAMKKTSQQI